MKAGTLKFNTLYLSVFVLLTYLLLVASMAKNSAVAVQYHDTISVDKSELIALNHYEKLITTVFLKPSSHSYQGKIFITSEQGNAQVSLLSFEALLITSLIDIVIPFIALFVMALTSVVVNAFYFNKKMTIEIAPLCHKVDNIISSYQLEGSVKESSISVNALKHSLDVLLQISSEYKLKAEALNGVDMIKLTMEGAAMPRRPRPAVCL